MAELCGRCAEALDTYEAGQVVYLWEGLCELNLRLRPTYPPLARLVSGVVAYDGIPLSAAYAASTGSCLRGLRTAVDRGVTADNDMYPRLAASMARGSRVYFYGNSLNALRQLSSMVWRDPARKLQVTIVESVGTVTGLAKDAERMGLRVIPYNSFQSEADRVDYLVLGVFAIYDDGVFAHPGTLALLQTLKQANPTARVIVPAPADKRWPDRWSGTAAGQPSSVTLDFVPISSGLIDRLFS
jgi:hypothetical protein